LLGNFFCRIGLPRHGMNPRQFLILAIKHNKTEGVTQQFFITDTIMGAFTLVC
jgi:hypothetical protein